MQLRFLDGQEIKFRRRKKPLDVELIFSPPRRILAQLTEAVSVKAVLRGVSNAWRFCEERRKKTKDLWIPNITQIPEKEDKTRLVAHFLNLVYLDDASSQGYMHIDKSMNEEVHALACCILS